MTFTGHAPPAAGGAARAPSPGEMAAVTTPASSALMCEADGTHLLP
ncbi:hypothetical protein [Sorangium sp. So ce176]